MKFFDRRKAKDKPGREQDQKSPNADDITEGVDFSMEEIAEKIQAVEAIFANHTESPLMDALKQQAKLRIEKIMTWQEEVARGSKD